ncbi:hypothetical protein [Fundidesulfovibrio butyratiphilus]
MKANAGKANPDQGMAFSFQIMRKASQEGKYGIAQDRTLGFLKKAKKFNGITMFSWKSRRRGLF